MAGPHALRAVMEGVAFNLCWLRTHVERFVNRKFDGFIFIGGWARSDLWCQILADSLGLPIRRMAQPEMAISRGAAMVAWAALGRVRPARLSSRWSRATVPFRPNCNYAAIHRAIRRVSEQL